MYKGQVIGVGMELKRDPGPKDIEFKKLYARAGRYARIKHDCTGTMVDYHLLKSRDFAPLP